MNRVSTVKPATESGFTLIELIVALSVLSLFTLLAMQSLSLSRASLSRGVSAGERLEETLSTQTALRRQLQQLIPALERPTSASGNLVCMGSADAMSFFTAAPNGSGKAVWMSLEVVTEGGSKALRATWCDLRTANRFQCASAAQQEEFLIRGLRYLRFEYALSSTAAGPGRRGGQWTDCSTPPQLIRVLAEFPQGDRRRWPELAVRPQIDAGADCFFDLVGQQCRRG